MKEKKGTVHFSKNQKTILFVKVLYTNTYNFYCNFHVAIVFLLSNSFREPQDTHTNTHSNQLTVLLFHNKQYDKKPLVEQKEIEKKQLV